MFRCVQLTAYSAEGLLDSTKLTLGTRIESALALARPIGSWSGLDFWPTAELWGFTLGWMSCGTSTTLAVLGRSNGGYVS